jgi:hypothetical protein
MPSPLPPQLSSSHASTPTTSSNRAQQYRKSSTDKPGLVQRTSSSTSLHRSASNKSNSSSGTSKGKAHHAHAHGHHPHVAHTSASTKHHRATSFGHRVPSYGKGLNKLTALTNVSTDEPAVPAQKEFLTIDSLVARAAAGTSLQRSLSEGNSIYHRFISNG